MHTREERRKEDKFAPIRTIWDLLIASCEIYYSPGSLLTVDEQLLGFRGHCPFRMYIANKPAKYGIKIVINCDAQSYYMLKGIPYLGKTGAQPEPGMNLGHTFTKQLALKYHNTNRNVTVDNWFTSVPLILDLLRNCGMTLLGTVRANKKEIPAIMNSKVDRKPGSCAFLYTKDITLLSFKPASSKKKNKKNVNLMSSFHFDSSLKDTGRPIMVDDYNRTKGGVDTFDQMCSTYSTSRKTKRWPMCVFYGMINIATINAYIIYCENYQRENSENNDNKVMDRKQFMDELATSLVKPWAAKRISQPRLRRDLKTTIVGVFDIPTIPIDHDMLAVANQRGTKTRCQVCTYQMDRKTKIKCVVCHKPVCGSHYYPMCEVCAIDRNDSNA